MFTQTFTTRFSETDALGHISNTTFPVWFEAAREPVFQIFTPSLAVNEWRLILAKIDISFHAQTYYGKQVEVRTYVSRIGSSSFDIYQELWQAQQMTASGTAVMVHFDHHQQRSSAIPQNIVTQLTEHLHTPTSE